MKRFNRDGKNKTGRRDSKRFSRKDSRKSGRRDSGRFSKGDSGRFDRRDSGRSNRKSEQRTMYEVTCDKCGKRCEVPFKPTGGKPVYCSDCFRKNGYSESRNQPAQFAKEFDQINRKLDKILKTLDSL